MSGASLEAALAMGPDESTNTSASADKTPTVDVFYLTFNAGKDFISSRVFGKHIYNAFRESNVGTTFLPELVAL